MRVYTILLIHKRLPAHDRAGPGDADRTYSLAILIAGKRTQRTQASNPPKVASFVDATFTNHSGWQCDFRRERYYKLAYLRSRVIGKSAFRSATGFATLPCVWPQATNLAARRLSASNALMGNVLGFKPEGFPTWYWHPPIERSFQVSMMSNTNGTSTGIVGCRQLGGCHAR